MNKYKITFLGVIHFSSGGGNQRFGRTAAATLAQMKAVSAFETLLPIYQIQRHLVRDHKYRMQKEHTCSLLDLMKYISAVFCTLQQWTNRYHWVRNSVCIIHFCVEHLLYILLWAEKVIFALDPHHGTVALGRTPQED